MTEQQDLTSELNPYDSSQISSLVPVTRGQKLLAVAIGGIVMLSSAVTMSAFLFGMLIGVFRDRMPTPLRISALFTGSMLRLTTTGGVIVAVIAVCLGFYSMLRVLRVQRSLVHASARRLELSRQLDAYRRSRPEK